MHNKGFTLIELLIVLTILSMIVVLMFGALRVGANAWGKGESDIEKAQKRRIVFQLLRQQLASIDLSSKEKIGHRPFYIKGNDKSMTFLSNVSIIGRETYGSVYVMYSVGKNKQNSNKLSIYEKSSSFLNISNEMPLPKEAEKITLLSDINGIFFEYLSEERLKDGRGWQNSWDPEIEKDFPLAIKIAVREEQNAALISIISRIKKEVRF